MIDIEKGVENEHSHQEQVDDVEQYEGQRHNYLIIQLRITDCELLALL